MQIYAWKRAAWLTVVIVLLCSRFASAQCPLPDGLDDPAGTCCTVTGPVLPTFPAFSEDVLDICWLHCNPNAVLGCIATWTAPVPASTATIPPICTVYVSKLKLIDAAGNLKWKSNVRMWYSRTWIEVNAVGEQLQVWRFLLNGDFKEGPAAGATPCPVPPCSAPNGNRARFTGYADYALNCSTNTWSHSWMMNHDCDKIDHISGYPRGGAFHGTRSYTFVGPAAGFVVSPVLPVEGGAIISEENVRRMDLPTAAVPLAECYFEEPLAIAQFVLQAQLCVCGNGPGQYAYQKLRVDGVCASQVSSVMQFPKGFLSKAIGSWTDPTVFPGREDVRWSFGGYTYEDCPGTLKGEVFYGATTMNGYPAFKLTAGGVGPALPLTFVDQGNSLRYPAYSSTYNIEYLSDHIINLNVP